MNVFLPAGEEFVGSMILQQASVDKVFKLRELPVREQLFNDSSAIPESLS